jgi:hypothetical protein
MQRNCLHVSPRVSTMTSLGDGDFDCFGLSYQADEQEEEETEVAAEEQAQEPKFNKHITPGELLVKGGGGKIGIDIIFRFRFRFTDVIIKLDASDEFLCKRIMNLPEKLVQDTHNTEEGLTRRLAEYRLLNGEDETVANVFEEEFDLTVIKMGAEIIEEDKSYLHKNIVDLIKVNYMKEARNYGLTVDEKEALKKIETEEKLKKEREEKEERERKEAEEAVERVRKQTEWVCVVGQASLLSPLYFLFSFVCICSKKNLNKSSMKNSNIWKPSPYHCEIISCPM